MFHINRERKQLVLDVCYKYSSDTLVIDLLNIKTDNFDFNRGQI